MCSDYRQLSLDDKINVGNYHNFNYCKTHATYLQLRLGQPIESLRFPIRRRTNNHIDDRRPVLHLQTLPHSFLQLRNRLTEIPLPPKHLHHVLVVRKSSQTSRRSPETPSQRTSQQLKNLRFSRVAALLQRFVGLLVQPPVNSRIVHDHYDDGKFVSFHRFDFHTRKTEGRVAFDADYPFSRSIIPAPKGCSYGETWPNLKKVEVGEILKFIAMEGLPPSYRTFRHPTCVSAGCWKASTFRYP